jgi:hypothetical protein
MAVASGPLVVALTGIRRQAPLMFGLLSAVTITSFRGIDLSALTLVPPVVLVASLFLAAALARGAMGAIVAAWQRRPAIFWLYSLVLLVEVLLQVYHGGDEGWAYVAGRAGFLLVLLSALATCPTADAAEGGLRGTAYGVGVIGLLTLVHALQILDMPFGAELAIPREFGGFEMPVPRTMGIDMSPGKVSMLAAVVLSTVIISPTGRHRVIDRRAMRVILFCLALAAVLITQTRGAYLVALTTLGLSGYLLLCRDSSPWFARRKGPWLVVAGWAALMVLGNVFLLDLAPDFVLDVGAAQSVHNVHARLLANSEGLRLLCDSPLLGIGHGTFEYVARGPASIHNHFWEQVVATGIAGGLPYLLFHVLVAVALLRSAGHCDSRYGAIGRTISAAVFGIFVGFQSFGAFFPATLAVLYGIALAIPPGQGEPAGHGPGQGS